MTTGQAILHLIFPGTMTREIDVACLSPEETGRAARFRFPGDATRWIAYRATLRLILGEELELSPAEVPLMLTAFGKPCLKPPHDRLHFNLSHSADAGIIALCRDGPVGVDLEHLHRAEDLRECETTFCHLDEIRSLPLDHTARSVQLLRIWTAKEALLKALGTGLSQPPETVRIEFDQPVSRASSATLLSGIENQQLHELHHPLLAQYQAFVAAPRSVTEILVIHPG